MNSLTLFLLKILPLNIFRIQGISMLPTLSPNIFILVSPLPYFWSYPNINDIVLCLDPRDKRILVKRITQMDSKKYFVTGDNSSESTDSRVFGMIERQAILAKVLVKLG